LIKYSQLGWPFVQASQSNTLWGAFYFTVYKHAKIKLFFKLFVFISTIFISTISTTAITDSYPFL